MLGAIKYHFRHLTDFNGRDARQTFWFWFLFLFIVNMVIGLAMSVPMMATAASTAIDAARSGNEAAVQAAMMNEMADKMRPLMTASIVLGLVNLALMAAPLVRRLHDSGKSGVFAVIVGAIYLFTLWQNWAHADEAIAVMRELGAAGGDSARAMEIQSRMAGQSLLGYLPIALVIVIGLLKSDPGPNRYGEEPVRF